MKPAFKNLASSLRTFQSELNAADAQRRKAAQTAVRIEGYRLTKVLKTEIKAGAPGGVKFKALSVIARKMGRGENRTPLKRLAIPVRYWVEQTGDRYGVSVGYQDRTIVNSRGGYRTLSDGITPSSDSKLSSSWLGIVRSQIRGATFASGTFNKRFGAYSDWQPRTKIVWNAFRGQPGKKKLVRGREKLLLRRSTSSLRLPARPIIDPFWATHQREAMANIERNFVAKLAGRKI